MSSTKKTDFKAEVKKGEFLFNKTNYQLLIASGALIVLAGILMAGSGDVFSTVKITVAPIVALTGFVLGIFAIMYRSKA